jgi:hypothetical protein
MVGDDPVDGVAVVAALELWVGSCRSRREEGGERQHPLQAPHAEHRAQERQEADKSQQAR